MPTADDPNTFSLSDVLEGEFEELHGPLRHGTGRPARERLAAVVDAVHRLETRRTALCLSGGGIRSATFALGVLQAFARADLLGCFDYLSTVSGGGYIGAWLSAWIKREPRGAGGVFAQLKNGDRHRPTPEPEPVRELRRYSNYLSPQLGLLSADSWTLVVTFIRNLLLNWTLLLPLLAVVVLIPQVVLHLVERPPGPVGVTIVTASGVLLGLLALAYAGQDLPSGHGRGWSVSRFKWFCLAPLATAVLLFTIAWAWHRGGGGDHVELWHLALGGAVLHALSVPFGWRRLGTSFGDQLLGWAAVAASGALGGALVSVGANLLFADLPLHARTYLVFAPAWLANALMLSVALFVGLASRFSQEQDREWWARAGSWVAIVTATWTALAAVTLFGPAAVRLLHDGAAGAWAAAGGSVTGVATAVLAYRSKTGLGRLSTVGSPLRRIVERYGLNLGAGIFILTLVLGMSWATDGLVAHLEAVLGWGRLECASGVLLVAAIWTSGLGFLIGINKFSLHSMYGNRLVRAYLGASNSGRQAYPLIGFDPTDSFAMHDLRPGRPFHIVNVALNVVRGDELAWQQRKARSFTVSRLHCGVWDPTDPDLRQYRPAQRYGGPGGISLGKAITISGAAASPNMGYHSSPLVCLVMTFFNARLGWWLGNPGRETWERNEPWFALKPLVDEALGLTTDANAYVYLSDGGHFENLGLYEMVLRRCHTIVVVDAGCDPKGVYEDLSAAIRKIRADIGIPITMHSMPSEAEPWGEGVIHYSAVDGEGTDGTLVCLKPMVGPGAPLDVRNYAAAHADPKNPFPQQSTADQFFSEAQFESYRALGLWVGQEAAGRLQRELVHAESAPVRPRDVA